MAKLVYEIQASVPELGALRGDVVVIVPGRPVVLIRQHPDTRAIEVLERYSGALTLLLVEDSEPPRSVAQLRRWIRQHTSRSGHLLVVD